MPGIEGHRQARPAERLVDRVDARVIGRRLARRDPRALRKDQDRPAAGGQPAGVGDHPFQGAGAARPVNRRHAGLREIEAEQRNPVQLAFQDQGRVVDQQMQGQGLPRRLMLGGDQERPRRQPVAAGHLVAQPGDRRQPGERQAHPQIAPAGDPPRGPSNSGRPATAIAVVRP